MPDAPAPGCSAAASPRCSGPPTGPLAPGRSATDAAALSSSDADPDVDVDADPDVDAHVDVDAVAVADVDFDAVADALTLSGLVEQLTARAAGADAVPDPEISARRIAAAAFGCETAELPLCRNEPVTRRMVSHADAMIARRCDGEPLQYVLGAWGFRGLDLAVDDRALIPRPETETVAGIAVDWLLEAQRARRLATPRVADLGTGCGAIALSIAAEVPSARVYATDCSLDALSLAGANLAGLGAAAARVTLHHGDWLDALAPVSLDAGPGAKTVGPAATPSSTARAGDLAHSTTGAIPGRASSTARAGDPAPVAPVRGGRAVGDDHGDVCVGEPGSVLPVRGGRAVGDDHGDVCVGEPGSVLSVRGGRAVGDDHGGIRAEEPGPVALSVMQRTTSGSYRGIRAGEPVSVAPALRGRLDAIVSNPPYVADGDELPSAVRDWEPHRALYAGPDGLDALRRIVRGARGWLAPGGLLVLELAPHQAAEAVALAAARGYEATRIERDLAGRDRVLVAQRPVDEPPDLALRIGRAAERLCQGELVIAPTDTLCGIMARYADTDAVTRVCDAKERPHSEPMPILVSGLAQADELVELSRPARTLAQRHWPGGLTLVARRRAGPDPLHGRETLGVRAPALGWLRWLIDEVGPVTGTSANRHGVPTPPDASTAAASLAEAVAFVIDGIALGGVASTVVDVTGDQPVVLRAGAVPPEALECPPAGC